ncbi:HK97-gp10 family putative phage morphogenesis protein [Streptococcus pluranimalium]|uniref:HK97 gp10 family phage protein n=1 Tax=Streptococcus pluranimalium TaxID=82348 RepID=A0A345VIK0_9STRE|nr:HK97-gp10 family putative phage morphogenesis protein [Streptococcus pluranimalium]AXJ12552.1 hypothetical protein Sp14A_06230 [Streptococcus pluranimalium]
MDINFEGLEELRNGLLKEATMEKKKAAVRKHTTKLKSSAIKHAVFTGGRTGSYSTGATRQKIMAEYQPTQGKVKATTHYSGYLEVGTRYMSAQSFMKPAMEEIIPAYLADLAKSET